MTAPAEALNRFWADLRDKSRVRIEAPDLPGELAEQAGNLVAVLWGQAQSKAQESLADFRGEIDEQLITLRTERDTAVAAQKASAEALSAIRQGHEDLEQKLTIEVAARKELEIRLLACNEERDRLQLAVKESREGFSRELDKVRAALHTIESRSEEEIRRHLLEIDRERSLARKANQELSSAKSSMAKQQASDKAELGKLQGKISNLREDLGKLQGQLAQVTAQLRDTKKELSAANAKLAKATSKAKPRTAGTRSPKK